MARPLPHNKEAEAAVLAGILLRNTALDDVVTLLDAEAFYVPAHRAVYKAMLKLSSRGQPIDPVTLEHQLRATDEFGLVGGMEGLGKLSDRYASSQHVTQHAELVRQTASVRRVVVAATDIAEEGREGVEEPAAFIDKAEQRLLAAADTAKAEPYASFEEVLPDVFESIANRAKQKNPITGVPTGYYALDSMTGGLQPSDMVVLAARPSMGKTALAINIVDNAAVLASGDLRKSEADRPPLYPTLFCTAEMSIRALTERFLCARAGIDSTALRAGRLTEREFRELIQAADCLHQSPVYLEPSSSPSIPEIRSRARRFRRDRRIAAYLERTDGKGLIVVDYLQLCRGGSKNDTRELEIGEVSRGLKAVAKDMDWPVLVLSQLNRGPDTRADHRPMLGDLRESGAIEQDADVVMFLYRPARYETDKAEQERLAHVAELDMAKQRNGPCGTIALHYEGQYTRFGSVTPS